MIGLDSAAFNALFDDAQQSVFRWEARERYAVPGDDASLRAFRTPGQPRPERSVRTSPWLRRIAVQTAAGVHWSRVRPLSEELSEYDQWSLLAYVESQAAGEEIRIARRVGRTDTPDFWLIDPDLDSRRGVLMRYDDEGHLLARELVVDGDVLDELAAARAAALEASRPLNVWLAQQAVANA